MWGVPENLWVVPGKLILKDSFQMSSKGMSERATNGRAGVWCARGRGGPTDGRVRTPRTVENWRKSKQGMHDVFSWRRARRKRAEKGGKDGRTEGRREERNLGENTFDGMDKME